MEITIRKATEPEEFQQIEEFVHANFMGDMPLIRVFGLEDAPRPPRSPGPRPSHSDDFSVTAVDPGGELVGVAINRVNPSFSLPQDTPPEVKKVKTLLLQRHLNLLPDHIHIKKSRTVEMVEFMDFVEKDAELGRLPPRTIELRVLSVRADWRQRGVARRLADESVRLARLAGFSAVRVFCTSEFTARLARSLGWRELYRLAVADYPRLSGQEVALRTVPPHDTVYYYYTTLEN